MIQIGGRSYTVFPWSLLSLLTGKSNENMPECNLQQSLGRKKFSDMFPIKNGLQQGGALSACW